MSKKHPQYTTEFKANCVVVLQGQDYPRDVYALERVAKHLNVSGRSLRRWYNTYAEYPTSENRTINDRALSEYVIDKKIELTDMLESIIYGVALEVKDRIDKKELEDVSLPHLMTALGISIDKRQLLLGEPTSNVNMGSKMSDEEKRVRMKELAYAIVRELHEQA